MAPPESPGQHQVVLGGQVYKVKTYGDLVTAVIHPSHNLAMGFATTRSKDELSPMPQFNETMTINQMINIVTFLHSRYKERPTDYEFYPMGY